MTPGLQELLERMREHPSFPELLKAVEAPGVKHFRAGSGDVAVQQSEWIFRSGRHLQHELWRQFLSNPRSGENQAQEKS